MEILISFVIAALIFWVIYKLVLAGVLLYIMTNDPFDPKVDDEDKT